MRKITAMILSIVMLLCAASALAEEKKVTIGTVSINGVFKLQCGLPEGYTPIPGTVLPDQVTAVIKSEDPDAPIMQLSVAFDEKYFDVERLNDLDSEELARLEETYYEEDPDVEISYGETGYGTLLLIARHESEALDYVTFFSIYKGYCVEFALVPSETAEDKNLTEDQLRISVDFLTDLDFIPVTEAAGTQSVAGGKFLARLTDYNAEENTVKAEVLRPIMLDRETVEELQEGDILTIGQDAVTVETLEKDEFGAMVNGETELRYAEDGTVRVLENEKERAEIIATLTLEIPDGLVFLDGIDPESGDALETPTEHTAEEFVRMLTAGGDLNFSSDNVNVTFDENGDLERVERFYTPWQ